MAITGIDTIEGKQIIAAGAVSAKSAEMAYNDENGNPITGYQVAGDYYSASNPSGFITGVDLTPYQTVEGMTAYATVESLTAKQDAGNYLSATDSANFLLTSESGNFYPMTGNPSGFINELPEEEEVEFEEIDLADYQPVSSMTAYQSAGDYYSASNPSGFITGVPDTYLQNTDLSTEDGKVTAISGIPLSAGGDVPEGVMVESGLEYNAVNEISAYNGSAIAQYGAEKQFIVHDDTLVHASNSAQYALGVNLSAVAQLLGVDETVLYSGNLSQGNKDSIPLSEPVTNFEKFKVYGAWNYNTDARMYAQVEIDTVNSGLRFDLSTFGPVVTTSQQSDAYCYFTVGSYKFNTPTAIDVVNAVRFHTNLGAFSDSDTIKIYKVVGIGRKEV